MKHRSWAIPDSMGVVIKDLKRATVSLPYMFSMLQGKQTKFFLSFLGFWQSHPFQMLMSTSVSWLSPPLTLSPFAWGSAPLAPDQSLVSSFSSLRLILKAAVWLPTLKHDFLWSLSCRRSWSGSPLIVSWGPNSALNTPRWGISGSLQALLCSGYSPPNRSTHPSFHLLIYLLIKEIMADVNYMLGTMTGGGNTNMIETCSWAWKVSQSVRKKTVYVHIVNIHITKYVKVSPKGHTNNGNDIRKESDPLCLEWVGKDSRERVMFMWRLEG